MMGRWGESAVDFSRAGAGGALGSLESPVSYSIRSFETGVMSVSIMSLRFI